MGVGGELDLANVKEELSRITALEEGVQGCSSLK